ncbi:hypothetical protein CFY91_08610 [Pseudomonas fluvialis]|nr:hypothetical protein CFY91_08610 [Pseudomonas fluvialis]
MKNVGEAGKTRRKRPKKRSLRVVNEHFEAVFNAVLPTQVVFQRPAKRLSRPPSTQYSLHGGRRPKPRWFCNGLLVLPPGRL